MSPLRFLAFFPRASRPRFAVVLALASVMLVSAACQGTKAPPLAPAPPPPPPEMYCDPGVPTNPAQYQAVFDQLRASNAKYFVAADGGIPIGLGDGGILWFFGDTVLGRWTPGGPVNPYLGLGSNSFVLQYGGCFTPFIEAIPDQPNGEWIWPTGAIRQGNVLRVFGQHMRPASGPLPFEFVRTEVVTFSLPGLALQSIQPLPVPTSPNYGENVFFDGTHVYAYGRVPQGGFGGFRHFVARAPVADILDGTKWAYWHDDDPNAVPPVLADGVGDWMLNTPNGADPMFFDDDGAGGAGLPSPDEAPGAGFPVASNPNPGQVLLGSALGVDFIAPADLMTWHAMLPEGPWNEDETLANNVPAYGSGQRTYGGRVVFGLPNGPLALWSLNHDSFDAVLANPELYKVIFGAVNAASLTP